MELSTISVFLSGIFKLLLYGRGWGGGEGRVHKHSLPVAVSTQHITQLNISLKNMTTLTEEPRKIKKSSLQKVSTKPPLTTRSTDGEPCVQKPEYKESSICPNCHTFNNTRLINPSKMCLQFSKYDSNQSYFLEKIKMDQMWGKHATMSTEFFPISYK